MSLSAGLRLWPYEIIASVGAGEMGEVYKARDTRRDRIVAMKVLPAPFATDPQFRERFEREAKAISQLSHPHICILYDVGRQDGLDYPVMEYLEGQTLAERLGKGALPLTEIWSASRNPAYTRTNSSPCLSVSVARGDEIPLPSGD